MSTIAWTDHTTNVQIGCSRVSPGCQRCYAEAGANSWPKRRPDVHGRYLKVIDGKGRWNGEIYLDEAMLTAGPTTPKRKKTATGWRAPRVFLGSMTDQFHEKVTTAMFESVLGFIQQRPGTIWQLVTKRPERARAMLKVAALRWKEQASDIGSGRWPRIHLLTTVEDQQRADERVPPLLECKPYVELLGLSVEPLLGPVHLTQWIDRLGWVIVGGESGPKARPCQVDWIRSVIQQAEAAGVPAFCKQLGSNSWVDDAYVMNKHPKGGDPSEWPADLYAQEFPQ